MNEMSLARATVRFLATLQDRQDASGGEPVSMSVAEWERETGIPEALQIRVRQTLMISGLMSLSVQDGEWTYALADG